MRIDLNAPSMKWELVKMWRQIYVMEMSNCTDGTFDESSKHSAECADKAVALFKDRLEGN